MSINAKSTNNSKALLADAPASVKSKMILLIDDCVNDEVEYLKYLGKQRTKNDNDKKDSGIRYELIQRYLPQIQLLAVDKDATVRYATSQVLLHILERNIIHPASIIDKLIALSTDTVSQTVETAEKALLYIHKLDSKIISTRIKKGINEAYLFHINAFSDPKRI